MPEQKTPQNPYVGPRAFQKEDKDRLFGRDREVEELLNLLIAQRIILVYSPSGAGKTSLIQARLIPRLVEEYFHVFPVARVNLQSPPTINKPDKFNRYVYSVLASLEVDLLEDQKTPADKLVAMTLEEYLDQCPKDPDAPSSEVLIFDQFEEILTVSPFDQEGRAAFFAQLGAALRNRKRWALIAVREDYLAALDPYVRPVPTRLANTYRLDLLGVEAALEAIIKPAQQEEVKFNDNAAKKLVDDLRRVKVLRPELTVEAQMEPEEQLGPYVEPVQLQVVCYRLWEQLPKGVKKITEKDVVAIGDVDSALAEYYADRVKSISEQSGVKERVIRDWFEYRLITERGIRNQVLLEPDKIGLDLDSIRRLVNAHLVRQERRGGLTYFELAHDRLIQPVRENNATWKAEHLSVLQRQATRWDREGRRDYLLLRDQALVEAEAWAAANPDELTQADREFLEACQSLRAKEEQDRALAEQTIRLEAAEKLAEAEQQRREAAEKLAETERQRSQEQAAAAAKLRQRALYLAGALAMVLVLLIAAIYYANQAEISRSIAEKEAAAARAAEATARAAENQAVAEAAAARAAEKAAREAKVEEEKQRKIAEQQTKIATARQLAAQAFNLKEKQTDLALLLGVEGNRIGVSNEPIASLLDVLSGSSINASLYRDDGYILSLDFNQDGSRLVAAGYDNRLRLWDISAGRLIAETQPFFPVNRSIISPDGGLAVLGDFFGGVTLWDVAGGETTEILPSESDSPAGIAISPDGKFLAVAGTKLSLWDLATLQELTLDNNPFQGQLAFSPDGEALAAVHKNGNILLYDVKDQQPIGEIKRQDLFAQVQAAPLIFLGIGQDLQSRPLVFAIDENGQLTAWDLNTLQVRTETSLESDGFYAFNSAQSILAYSRPDGEVDACFLSFNPDVPCGSVRSFEGHPGGISTLALNLDGNLLAAGNPLGTITIWQLMGSALTGLPLQEHDTPIAGVAFSELNGNQVVVSTARGENKSILLWDVLSRKPIGDPLVSVTKNNTSFNPLRVAFAQDGETLISVDKDGKIRLWDTSSFALLTEIPGFPVAVRSAAFSPESKFLVLGDDEGIISLFNPNTGEQIKSFGIPSSPVTSLAFSPDGKLLASGSQDGVARIWDLTTGQSIRDEKHQGPVLSLAFSYPFGNILAVGTDISSPQTQAGRREYITLWDLSQPKSPPRRLSGPRGAVTHLAFNPVDIEILASGSRDGRVYIWDLSSQARFRGDPLPDRSGTVTNLAFTLDGRFLIAGFDQEITLWNIDSLEIRGEFPGTAPLATNLVVSPDGNEIAAGDVEGKIHLWSLVQGKPIGDLGLPEEVKQGITSFALAPDKRTLATGGEEGTILLWDLEERQTTTQPLLAHTKAVSSLAYSSDGTLASGGRDGNVVIWDSNGKELVKHTWELNEITTLDFSPKGGLLVLVVTDLSRISSLYLWDLSTPGSQPKKVGPPQTEDSFWPVTSMAFDSIGDTLVLGRENGMISRWDVAGRQWLQPLSAGLNFAQVSAVTSLAFSQVGGWFASGLADGTLILWDADDWEQIGRLAGHSASINALGFSPDGKTLASGGADANILLWEVDPQQWIQDACKVVGRNLSWAEWVKYLSPDQNEPYHETCLGNFVPSDVARHYLALAKSSSSNPDLVESNLDLAVRWSAGSTNETQLREICQSGNELNFAAKVQHACDQVGGPISDPLELAYYYSSLGDIERARQTAEQIGDPLDQAYFFANIGDEARARQAAEQIEDPLGQAYFFADLGDIERARQAAEQIEDPLDLAYFYLDIGDEVRAREVAERVQDPLDRAYFYIYVGDQAQAEQAYMEASQAAETSRDLDYLKNVCWYGSLDGFSRLVLPVCERGVELASGDDLAFMRDSRGLARALTGDYAGAIEDFQFFVDWLRSDGSDALPDDLRDEVIARRERFISLLSEGQNPFDEETLQELSNELFLSL